MVFWWTGRGYLALLSLIGAYGVFGAIMSYSMGEDAFDRFPWLWGIALLSAAATWYLGCRVNGRSLRIESPRHLRSRLFYNAQHRFL